MIARLATAELRPGHRIRIEEPTPGEGWHPARSVRRSVAGVVVSVRDLGPTVLRRYRLTVRLVDGRLVTFECRAQASQMLDGDHRDAP